MRRIFLDLGAHVGESTKFFRKHHPEADQFEFFLFEPLPENVDILRKLDDVTIIDQAVSTRNGLCKFYTGMSESGSLAKEKRTGGLDGERSVMVHTIDFVSWFNELVRGDYVPEIWLKMNVEGAEYEIIDYLHQCGLLRFVHKFYINWHWNKIGMSKEEHDRVKAMIPADKLYRWWAMFGDDNIQWFKDSL
jgi:FkbM family methyltransferase